MIYLGTVKNSWNQIKISKTVAFSSIETVLDSLIKMWTEDEDINVEGRISLNLSLYYSMKFYNIHEMELDVEKRPKKLSWSKLEKELAISKPELYAKLLLLE